MTAFVKECRREWERLGVPDLLADEMAAELESDLAEAEADGVSATEMLGESDPRRFAATWASERGLVSRPVQPKRPRRTWPWVVVAVFLFFVFLLSWLALQTLGSSGSSAPPVPVQVVPARGASVPNVVGMRACKALRVSRRAGFDAVRVQGHAHFDCDLIVVGQTPVPGRVGPSSGHRRVRLTLRVRRD